MFCSIFTTTFLLSFSCITNLIDTYIAVPIDVRITLPIYLDSFSICILISLTPAYMYLNMSSHFPSSSISVRIYSYVHVYVFCNGLYLWPISCFVSSFPTNLIDTYDTVCLDALITLLISLSSASSCISISVIHTCACVNLCTHFPPFPFSCTFIAICIYIHVSTIL